MSWRNNVQRSGMNAQPLGAVRRWGGGGGGGSGSGSGSGSGGGGGGGDADADGSVAGNRSPAPSASSYAPPPAADDPPPRSGASRSQAPYMINGVPSFVSVGAPAGAPGSAPVPGGQPVNQGVKRPREESAGEQAGGRKRRSRWGDEKVQMGGITTAITSTGVSHQELDKYANLVRLEEITRLLVSGNVAPEDGRRSPSPPPTYDAQGRRTNTREQRYRKKLEEEKSQRIERQMQLDPQYQPPMEYAAFRRNMRPSEKVYLPLSEYPDINFFGLLVGPRGNTLKGMERNSGAKIAIRGKGSVKEGKGRPGHDANEHEPMHCIVSAESMEQVQHCIKLINKVIETAASVPEGENDHKRSQLRELAALNGTLRDDENQRCLNCGKLGHRKYECPEERNWTAHITCHRCGQQGHIARDCHQPRNMGDAPPRGPGAPGGGPAGAFDAEYNNLMAELHGGVPVAPAAPAAPSAPTGPASHAPVPTGPASSGPASQGRRQFRKIPPWRQPEVWNAPGQSRPGGAARGHGWGGQGNQGGSYDQPAQQWDQYAQPQQAWSGATGATGATGIDAAATAGTVDGQVDYSKQWAEYYAAQGDAATAAAIAAPDAGAAAAAPSEGGGDYSEAWAEYYRQQGYSV